MKRMNMKTKPDIRERARAAGAYLNMVKPTPGRDGMAEEQYKKLEMAAFMAVFHPEVKGARLRRIVNP